MNAKHANKNKSINEGVVRPEKYTGCKNLLDLPTLYKTGAQPKYSRSFADKMPLFF